MISSLHRLMLLASCLLPSAAFLLLSEAAGELEPGEVPMYVEPALASKLREHQQFGVRFLAKALLGKNGEPDWHGCILADDVRRASR